MLHKTVKAAATATDEGRFTAIAAAYSVDRMDEKILPGAFEKTIAQWQSSDKQIPVHWDHEGDPESIIGHADPKSMREAEEGLYIRGQLDLEGNEKARAAWRVMKSNAASLSFGYLVNDSDDVEGVKHLKEIDLFEISITPAPVNPDTRIVSMKSDNGTTFTTGTTGTDAKVKLADPATVVLGPGITITGNTKFDAGDDPGEEQPVEEAKELSEEVAADLRKGYERLAIDLMAAGVNPEAKVDKDDLYETFTVPELQEKAKLDAGNGKEQQIEEAEAEEPETANAPAQDPLRKAYDDLAYELTMRGISVAEPPKVEEEPKDDLPSMEELRKHSYDLMLETLIGSEKK